MRRNNCKIKFANQFDRLRHRFEGKKIWNDFITMYACAISNAVDERFYDEREQMYMRVVEQYEKEEMEVFYNLYALTVLALEKDPTRDFLGEMAMNLTCSTSELGQRFSPDGIALLTAGIVQENNEAAWEGYQTIGDFCCGSGSLLIANIGVLLGKGVKYQNEVLFYAQDIDFIAAMMCYVQLSLLGCAAIVNVGDSLKEPMTDRILREQSCWLTPMYFSDIWQMRRMIKQLTKTEV